MATYLITQATGMQSQWAISHLLEAGAKVHAVVRDLQKVPATLKRPGIELFQGQTEDYDSILKAAQGCVGVFLNTFPIPGLETQQAKSAVAACREAGVKTIVVSTSCCTGDKSMWDNDQTREIGLYDYYSSKSEVEGIVRAAGFETYTILRPAVIHGDFLAPNVYGNFPSLALEGTLAHACNDGVGLPQIDQADVGKYIAAALQDPAKFGGEEIELANQNITFEEAGRIITSITGRDIPVRKLTPEEIEAGKDTVVGRRFQLFANVLDLKGFTERAEQQRAKFGIPLMSLEASLQREKERLIATLPASA